MGEGGYDASAPDVVFFEQGRCYGKSSIFKRKNYNNLYPFSDLPTLPQPKSYRAAANVNMMFLGNQYRDRMKLEDHWGTGKMSCHEIDVGFKFDEVYMARDSRNPDPRNPDPMSGMYENQVSTCTDEKYCVHFFSETNYMGTEVIF